VARHGRGAGGSQRASRARVERSSRRPGRVETVELLERRQLLPAIFFIFSRAQCDAAAKACVDAGLDLVDAGERTAIRAIVDARLGGLEPADLEVLGFQQFVTQLESGVAAHHAGMVPPMKEVVEACFVEGLVKVVFATETLAVGINMPARTVVIEKLTKFTGEHHERLTPGEYTQLTGRAGRRGIDELGTAVVLWSPWVRFDEVAELAGSSSFHLRSAFRPTYNMAANLVRTYSSDDARHLLNLSFAQYQADRDVVRLEARLERRRAAAAELRAQAHSDYGDIDEYRRLRDSERDERVAGRAARLDAIDDALAEMRPGTVIHMVKGTYKGPAAVVAAANRKSGLAPDRDHEIGQVGVSHGRGLRRAAAPDRQRRTAEHLRPEPQGVPQRRGQALAQHEDRSLAEHQAPPRPQRPVGRQPPVARDPGLRDKLNAAARPIGSNARSPTWNDASAARTPRWPESSTVCSTCWSPTATWIVPVVAE
jgi:ATP-dependent RNA helicase HelY